MSGYAQPIRKLIAELGRLPGVGEKTATRLALHILNASRDDALRLAESIRDVKEKIRLCSVCFNLTDEETCSICRDAARDREVLCVVEEPDSLMAIEESGSYRGLYHVLHGAISPIDGIGPEQLRLRDLVGRIEQGSIREVVVATNPSVQGEATALLLAKVLRGKGVTLTRIAMGIPVGGDLKYTDRMTMARAMEFRRNL
ncbi:MAG TPA: recombination mediator RecR [Syntrophales bacterium]|nr:recombination mediator RecR [Syntrophales bacterium]HPX12441.1 recombination mediator RecR [Syntrophales bacterium]HQB29608.1 recombination mediator RecR [Syntrophales bacterium]HQN77279.1 recombination mediator RecR [Syntrophales bacterium]HQQ28549.1 recombination mediator RecR [Syntrophales bacterium]